MNWRDLIAKAKKAIEDGDLDAAKKFKEQAAELKALEELEGDSGEQPAAVTQQNDDIKAMFAEFRDLKAKLEAEPAQKAGGHLVVTEDETDKKAANPWPSLGEQLKAVAIATRYPHRADERLKAQKAIQGQNEQQGSEGGFLVQHDFAQNIATVMHESGDVLSRVRRIPISGNSNGFTMNAIDEINRSTGRWGGVTSYWAAEGASVSAGQLKFRQVNMELNKIYGLAYATEELLQDSAALESVIMQAVPEELTFRAGDAIVNGDGAGKPMGILNSPSLVTIPKESGQAAATLQYENIIKMWARCWGPSRRNAVWIYNQDIEPQLLSMDFPIGTGGVPVFLPPGGLSQSPYNTLMGRPMIPTEFNQTLGTKGDLMLVDFSQYLLIEKGGIQSASSMHVEFLTGQMTYRFTYRIDGQSSWYAPMTPAKGSNTLSPFVALATR